MISGLAASELPPPLKPPVMAWPMVCPTAEPTATPAAVVAICAISPGCLGAGAATAEGGAAAGTAARGAGAGDAALLGGARLRGHGEKHHSIIIIVMTPNHAAAGPGAHRSCCEEQDVPSSRGHSGSAKRDSWRCTGGPKDHAGITHAPATR